MLLYLLCTSTEELIRDSKTGGNLGWSDHALLEFADLRDLSQLMKKVRILNFRKMIFHLFKELADGHPWKTSYRDKGAEQSWQLFKVIFLRAQELSISMGKK